MQSLNPLKRNLIHIPADLDAVTDYAAEVDPAAAQLKPANITKIWSATQAFYQTGTMPGISLCVRKGGHVVLNRALGHAQGNGPQDTAQTPKRLMTHDTPVCLFSASKGITAMLVHKIAETGAVDLQAPVAHYIPAFAKHGKERVKVAHVLEHRAGIHRFAETLDHQLLYDWDAVIDYLCDAKPRKPGRAQAYHAITGGYILGEVVRAATGRDVRQILAEDFAAPMGLTHFSYGQPATEQPPIAQNYNTGPKPVFPLSYLFERALNTPFEHVTEVSNEPAFQQAIIPAANVSATAEDASAFYQMLLNGGEYNGVQIMRPDTVRRAVARRSAKLDLGLMMPMAYGGGLMLGGRVLSLYGLNTPQAYGHLGFLNIVCWADPQRDISVALLTTGKIGAGPHLPAFFKLLNTINQQAGMK